MKFIVYVNSQQGYGVLFLSLSLTLAYLSVLCIGVKWITVSALTLYWSRVQRVLSSHLFWLGHQMAWSDQSMAMSGQNTNINKQISNCLIAQ